MQSLKHLIIVSDVSVSSEDREAVARSNLSFVNAAFSAGLVPEDLHPHAFGAFCVEYYRRFMVGDLVPRGLASFLHDVQHDAKVMGALDETLGAMGATAHVTVLGQARRLIARIGDTWFETFLGMDYASRNATPVKQALRPCEADFRKASRTEDLTGVLRTWLHEHPDLRPTSLTDMKNTLEAVGRKPTTSRWQRFHVYYNLL